VRKPCTKYLLADFRCFSYLCIQLNSFFL